MVTGLSLTVNSVIPPLSAAFPPLAGGSAAGHGGREEYKEVVYPGRSTERYMEGYREVQGGIWRDNQGIPRYN